MVLQGYDELMARFAAVKGGVADGKLMRALGNAAVKEQKLLFLPHKRTGITGRSIMLGAVTPTSVQTRVGFAGPFIELGTRQHVIKPRYKKALAFASQGITTERFGVGAILKFRLSGALTAGSAKKYGNAAFVVVKSVTIPAYAPHPFMVPGAQKAITSSGAGGIVTSIVTLWNEAA